MSIAAGDPQVYCDNVRTLFALSARVDSELAAAARNAEDARRAAETRHTEQTARATAARERADGALRAAAGALPVDPQQRSRERDAAPPVSVTNILEIAERMADEAEAAAQRVLHTSAALRAEDERLAAERQERLEDERRRREDDERRRAATLAQARARDARTLVLAGLVGLVVPLVAGLAIGSPVAVVVAAAAGIAAGCVVALSGSTYPARVAARRPAAGDRLEPDLARPLARTVTLLLVGAGLFAAGLAGAIGSAVGSSLASAAGCAAVAAAGAALAAAQRHKLLTRSLPLPRP